MHAIEKYIERREREREKVGFSPIGEREEEGVLTICINIPVITYINYILSTS